MPQSVFDCGIFKRCAMQILYLDKNLIAVNKPYGMPSQSDPTGDKDAMTLASEMLRDMGERDSLWLVHRLDRVVGGVLVFARNKESAAALSALVAERGAKKQYLAVAEGELRGGILTDLIFKDARKNKAFVVDRMRAGVKTAELEYSVLEYAECDKGVRSLLLVTLHTGRFHQIRVQFSSRGTPLVGDGKYGSHDNKAVFPALFSARLSFELKGKKYDIRALPDMDAYPWSLYSREVKIDD